MSVTYNKTNWVNDVTPLDANNMNNIENGIENLVNEFNAGSGSTITVDDALSSTSENPVQNKVIYNALDKKITEPSGNGLVRKRMSGMYGTMGVDTTMPTSPTDNNVPTTKLLKDYVGDKGNPLQLSDTDKTKAMVLIQHNYDSETSTGTYIGRSIDVNNLSESPPASLNIPTSNAVAKYVKNAINSAITMALNTEV